jgi:hypothetical protein
MDFRAADVGILADLRAEAARQGLVRAGERPLAAIRREPLIGVTDCAEEFVRSLPKTK